MNVKLIFHQHGGEPLTIVPLLDGLINNATSLRSDMTEPELCGLTFATEMTSLNIAKGNNDHQ